MSAVHLFTGKGGVGKTTVAAAAAIAAAANGKRPLIIEVGHRAQMNAVFGVTTIAHKPQSVGRGVFAMCVDPDEAVTDYVVRHVKLRGIAKRITQNRVLGRFFKAAPAVQEVAVLNVVQSYAEKGKYDPILVDLDATGHAMMFLSLPQVFEGIAREGPLRALLDRFTVLLRAKTTALHIITLPQELPVEETLELNEKLVADDNVRLGSIIVNNVPSVTLTPRQRAAVFRRDDGDALLAKRALTIEHTARTLIDSLKKKIARSTIELPRLPNDPTLDELLELGRTMTEVVS